MTQHIPPTEFLADYASGAASPGVSLLVATHLTYSPISRAQVAMFERLGGTMLRDEDPAEIALGARDKALAAINGYAPGEKAAAANGADAAKCMASQLNGSTRLPAPLRSAIEHPESHIPFRFRLPGVSEYVLPGFEDEQVSLLRARPGAGIPQHTHEGIEMTLVLSGEMDDGGTIYRRGDVAVNTEDDDHRPRITGTETCLCLVVMDGGLRFTGRFSRALNVLAE
ncbi:MAG: ChrR family anti-sigma-E factor [Pseudomonadota bacterium]